MKQRHDDPQFKFRIPLEMKERLEAAAKEKGRTLTAEILQRLAWTLDNHRYILHGPDGPEPSGPEDALGAITNTEMLIVLEQETLGEMEAGTYQTTLSPREMAGAIAMQKIHIARLKEKLSVLKKNIFEEKIRARIEEANREWDLKYPDGNGDGSISPWDAAVAEWDRVHGNKGKK
ncbi:Arc family DNA-binding protein [Gluconobacter oxydans]|uniref:Arc family DNA-binding protein n=1 Tax=Gluconobacter oxydans TaxID=442 RepID=UPI0039ED8307